MCERRQPGILAGEPETRRAARAEAEARRPAGRGIATEAVPERKGKEEESMNPDGAPRLLGERRVSAPSPNLRPEAVWGRRQTGNKAVGSHRSDVSRFGACEQWRISARDERRIRTEGEGCVERNPQHPPESDGARFRSP